MTMEQKRDEFDGLLDDVLRSVANPEMPERTRAWVGASANAATLSADAGAAHVVAPTVFFDFQERMRPRRDARSTAIALVAHAAAIALIFWAVARHVQFSSPVKQMALTTLTPPPVAPVKKDLMGGGGGQRGPTPVSKGALPKFADTQITPPKAPPLEQPKIKMPDPTIEVQKDLKMANNTMPNFGMPTAAVVGNSMGNGSGTGVGSGSGSGLGSGSGGNYGGGLRRVGGGVSAPVALITPEPEFSEEARRAKFQGIVTVSLIVDTKGNPQSVHIAQGVGMGLDEKALEAVKEYKFKPAMENGKPVPVQMNVVVTFQLL